jgi:hypothetical protein
MLFMQKENLLIAGWQLNRASDITFLIFSFREKLVHTNLVVQTKALSIVLLLQTIHFHILIKI